MDAGFLQVKLLAMMLERADEVRRAAIRKMLLQKILYLSRKIAAGASGTMRTVVSPYRPGLEELEVDSTLEAMTENPLNIYENIYCSERVKQKSSYVLMLDVSNSMHQEKVAIGAIATGVFARKLRNEFHAVVAFSRESSVVKHLSEPNNLEELVKRMLDLRTGGATDLRRALIDGHTLLRDAKTMSKTGIIVTDGWATVGGDPVEVASMYDRLHVLGISFGLGGSDPRTNQLIALRGGGRYMYVQQFEDLPMAIAKILTR